MSRYRVSWADVARRDLERIIDFIDDEAPLNSGKVLGRIEEAASALKTFPERGRIVPELRWHGIERYRELQLPPWRIIYRVEPRRVEVLAVFDGRRSLEDVLLDRFLEQ